MSNFRNKLIGVIHAIKNKHSIHDDVYRDLLFELTHQTSCKDMNVHQLMTVSNYLKAHFKWHTNQTNRFSPQRKKIYAQWSQLAKMGKVKNDSKQACDAWTVKQIGCRWYQLDEANSYQLNQVIEALKIWINR